jgi:hypothetical protein
MHVALSMTLKLPAAESCLSLSAGTGIEVRVLLMLLR